MPGKKSSQRRPNVKRQFTAVFDLAMTPLPLHGKERWRLASVPDIGLEPDTVEDLRSIISIYAIDTP